MTARETLFKLHLLLGNPVLLPIPLRQKWPQQTNWQTLTFDDTQSQQYRDELYHAALRGGNIGVRLGPASGRLLALDLDDDSLIDEWIRRHPWLADTLRTCGQRGCQFWMRLETGCEYPNSKAVFSLKENGKEIGELRLGGCGGAQSIIFGIHPAGMRYQIVVNKAPIEVSLADLDELAPDILFPEKPNPPISPVRLDHLTDASLETRVHAYLNQCEPARDGERGHDTTYRVACQIVNGFRFDPETALRFMRYYNQKCEPPWSEKELQHKVDEALKAQHNKAPGHLLEHKPPANPLFSQQLQNDYPQPTEPPTPKPEPETLESLISKSVCAGTQLEQLDIPRRLPVIGDWFKEGDLGFIFAHRGIGKTWMSLGISVAIATTDGEFGPWKSLVTWPVLYVDGEMPVESIRDRIKGLSGNYPENLKVLNHEVLFHKGQKVLNLADIETQSVITSYCESNGVKLVVIDNLSCLFSGVAENKADAWEGVRDWFLNLRRRRIAAIVVHHTGRNKEFMRGTSRREDAAFWVMRLDKVIGIEMRNGVHFISRFTKHRNSQREQPALEWKLVPDCDGMIQVTVRKAEGLQVFRQLLEEGLTRNEEIAQEMGVTSGTVSKMAKKAIDAGWLQKNHREYQLK